MSKYKKILNYFVFVKFSKTRYVIDNGCNSSTTLKG